MKKSFLLCMFVMLIVQSNASTNYSHLKTNSHRSWFPPSLDLDDSTRIGGCDFIEMNKRFIDLSNQRFGRLTVTSLNRRDTEKQRTYFNCLCDCGNTCVTTSGSLRHGTVKSCGCYAIQRATEANITHGYCSRKDEYLPEYRTWAAMRQRCLNPKNKIYSYYGGRGITICDRWMAEDGFENFLADMGRKPTSQHTIDRIENNGNYEPDNCRWGTKKEQAQGRRSTVWFEIKGVKMTSRDFAKMVGVNGSAITYHLRSKTKEQIYSYYQQKGLV